MGLDDDSDDSSTATPETLDQFREKWQYELTTTKLNKEHETIQNKPDSKQPDNINDQVKIHIIKY